MKSFTASLFFVGCLVTFGNAATVTVSSQTTSSDPSENMVYLNGQTSSESASENILYLNGQTSSENASENLDYLNGLYIDLQTAASSGDMDAIIYNLREILVVLKQLYSQVHDTRSKNYIESIEEDVTSALARVESGDADTEDVNGILGILGGTANSVLNGGLSFIMDDINGMASGVNDFFNNLSRGNLLGAGSSLVGDVVAGKLTGLKHLAGGLSGGLRNLL